MSGSVTPTHCSVYIWKLPRAASAEQRQQLARPDVDGNPDPREILLDHRRLHPVDLRRRGLQRQAKAGQRAVTVGIREAGLVEQPLAPRAGSW